MNQCQCNASWAIAAVGAVESAYAIKTGNLTLFSAQQLIDCDEDNKGCDYGTPWFALDYFKDHKIMLESDYPFVGHQQECKYNESKAITNITNTSTVSNSSALKNAIA